MDLFEKVVVIEKIKENAERRYEELRKNLRSQFIDIPYQLKEIEAKREYDTDPIKVYYPILDTPEGFVKEDEKFYRKYANCVIHEYTLIDKDGKKATILEELPFNRSFDDNKKYWLQLGFNISSSSIEYIINISGKKYKFARKIELDILIKQVIGENDVAKYDGTYRGHEYEEEEGKYIKFLEGLSRTKEIVPLKELAKGSKTKIEISETFSANVESSECVRNAETIWLENGMYRIGLYDVKYFVRTVKIKPYYNNSIKLEEVEFEYIEIENEEELRKGKTLNELFEMLQIK